jgi:hypothetical protein
MHAPTECEPAATPEVLAARAQPGSMVRVRRVVTVVFYAIVAALLALYVARMDFAALARIRIDWRWFGTALVVGVAQRLLIPLTWVLMLRNLGVNVGRYANFNFVYAKAWLGRYMPGKVAMVAARVYFAEELGASRRVVAVSSVAELGAQLLVMASAGVIGIASLARSFETFAPYRPVTYAMIGVLAFVLWPPVFNRLMRFAFVLLRRPVDAQPTVSAGTLAWAVLGFSWVSAATGVLAVLLAASVDPVAFEYPVFIWGAYNIAGALGMAAVFAPSGLGAREAVQMPLFLLVFSPEAALAIAVVSRLAELVIDALFYGVSMLAARRARNAMSPATSSK